MAEVTVELGRRVEPLRPIPGEVWDLGGTHYLITDEGRALILRGGAFQKGALSTQRHDKIAEDGHRIAAGCTITYTPEGGAS